MLHEVDAHFAGPRAPPQAADRHGRIGQQRGIARLDDQAIEELKSAPARFKILVAARCVAGARRQSGRGAEALQIEGGGVAWRVGLVIVEERAGFLLLKAKDPVGNGEAEFGEARIGANAPPGEAGLRQPRHLPEPWTGEEAMPVIAKGPSE